MFFFVSLVLLVVAVYAQQAPHPMLPAYVQAINAKYDKQAEDSRRTYWQSMLVADTAKLKDLQAAMVTAAKQNQSDAIPLIQKEIDETKQKITQDANRNSEPLKHTAFLPGKFRWNDGPTVVFTEDGRVMASNGNTGTWDTALGETMRIHWQNLKRFELLQVVDNGATLVNANRGTHVREEGR